MNLNLQTLRNIAQYAPHRVYALILVAMAVMIPSIAIFAYGPERPTFTAAEPATYVTFNSIKDSPGYGDERNFVLIKDAANTADGGFTDTVNAEPGKEYIVRMLVHNNAAANLNLVATNTRVKANVPTTTGNEVQIDGFVTADNSNPGQVWDDVVLKSDKRFNVAYVPGSAAYYNQPNLSRKFTLPDSIVTNNGAQVGFDAMDGNLPGCNQFSGVAVFRVKVQGEAQPNFEMTKQVRKHTTATGGWTKSVAVNPGESVDYLISYKNSGQTQQNNVVVKDSLAPATTYTAGSSKLASSATPAGAAISDNITKPTGVNIGSYAPSGNAFVAFTAKVAEEKDLPQCGNNVLRNTATVETDNGSKQDNADVTVNKKCENQASYSCDALQATKISALEYGFNVKLSSNMATAKEVTIDFGDGQNATRDIASLPVNHTYAAAGQYTIKATASFDVNGKTVKDVTSDACKTVIDTNVTPASTGGAAPTELPSTGPVEVFAGILGASAFGLGIQQWYASRRAVAEAMNIVK
jgi:uncharacterized repeat protein (TIGR01451 family)